MTTEISVMYGSEKVNDRSAWQVTLNPNFTHWLTHLGNKKSYLGLTPRKVADTYDSLIPFFSVLF